MAAKQKVRGKAAVVSTIKGEDIRQKHGKVEKFEGPNAEVRVDLGATLNMGNYESLRLGVSLMLPCNPTPAAVEQAFAKAVKFTEAKLDKMIKANREAGVSKGDVEADI